jgi:hypothetical protein
VAQVHMTDGAVALKHVEIPVDRGLVDQEGVGKVDG